MEIMLMGTSPSDTLKGSICENSLCSRLRPICPESTRRKEPDPSAGLWRIRVNLPEINVHTSEYMPITTLRVTSDLKDRLDSLKVHPRETCNGLLERLIALATDAEPLSDEAIQGLEQALEDIKAGRIHSEDEILRGFEL